jgi:tetratricopeptide (TPR) repeat protein
MIAALLLWCLLAQASSAGTTLSAPALEHLQAGDDAEKQHHFETAIAEYRRVTELAPTAAEGFMGLGKAYMENHQYGEAIPWFEGALERNPDLVVAHQWLGYALLSQGYAGEALPHLDKASEAGALGIAQMQVGQTSRAVANLQAALAKTPNDPDLLYYLSQASTMLAQESLDTVLAAYPDSARAHQARGHNYFVLHQLAEAEKQYQQALTLRPDMPGLHLELGQIYAEGSRWAKAEEQFQAETRLQPGNPEAAYRLGEAWMQDGRMGEATQELQRSDRLRPDMSETLYSLGKAAALSGDAGTAERAWRRVLALEQDSPLAAQAHFGLAGIYRKQGRAQEALRETQEFRRLRQATASHSPHSDAP